MRSALSVGFGLLSVFAARAAVAQEDEAPAPEPPVARAEPKPSAPVPFDPRWLEPYFRSGPLRAAAERFRLEDWRGASEALAKALRGLSRSSPERHPARFLHALALANLERWAEAAAIFEELYERHPLLAPYHAYNAARCRLRAGDAGGALAWADKVPAGTVPQAEAALVRIDALRAGDRWPEIVNESLAFLDKFVAGPRRPEARFRLAEALEKLGKATEATGHYRRIWAEAPLEAWADRAAERLEAIAGALPPAEAALLRTRTASEWVGRGMELFDKNRNADSEAACAAALTAPGIEPDLECKARFHRAQSVWKQRQRPRAAPLFDEAEAACARAGNADLHTKCLYQGARCYASKGEPDAAIARYARIEAERAGHSYADDARIRSAELAVERGDEEGAAKLLAELPERYPRGDLVNEALWRLGFSAWRAGRWDGVHKWLDENLRRIPHEEIWYAEGRALYWKARAFEKQGKGEEAVAFYERAVREYPLSVYSLFSLERMRASFETARGKLLTELHPAPKPTKKPGDPLATFSFAPQPLFGDPAFLRAVELARIGLGGEARRELSKMGVGIPSRGAGSTIDSQKEDLLWIAAVLLDRGGVWSASHAIPRYALGAYKSAYPAGGGGTEAKWRLSYPRGFPELVAKHTKANHLPEAVQLAIIREESAFNPRTESFANAMGLTQMIVRTAKRFADRPAAVTRDLLMDPAKNLEIGSRFLGFLWKRYDGNAPLAIAGYNAGEGAVDRWLKERGDLEMDEFVETIPFDETRNYTKRVLASYFAYSWLYDAKQPVPPIKMAIPKS